jgi:hypothetical protein
MLTPVQLYTSAGIPVGPRAVINFYRPPSAADTSGIYPAGYAAPNVAAQIGPGLEANGTGLGIFVVEDLTLDFNGTPYMQKGAFMESLDNPTVVREGPTLNMTVLMASGGVPSLMPGDYCGINIGMKATSTGSAPVPIALSRWVVGKNGLSTNGINKFSLNLILDRPNSSPNLVEF